MDRTEFPVGPLVDDLPDGYVEAGRDYHLALMKLGLIPELTLWVHDAAIDGWALMICTRLYDAVGGYGIMDLLFRAYDASATPRLINPFILRLESPNHPIIRDISATLSGRGMPTLVGITSSGEEVEQTADHSMAESRIGDLSFRHGWRYVVGRESTHPANPFKAFKVFKRSVEQRIAA
ncbi:hypothetical protein C8J24_2959 [Sphingomonas aerolata]|uniref:Uncharacterized protein n=1 Tax=Sphingomonas aerolata TaxID=185951 RepID=A0A2T4YMW0_9SPHN|nr:hypothetical protein [Sphingomonas aerolata]PTM44749.1 hypothetical protein C8J24_2959 [Sphingomonas aerolata]